jgi:hypothetical protein
MLRLTHAQTVTGAIRVDDIDDGLPNKEVHRLGSKGDPKSYKRDGYAGAVKQACYIPRTKIGDTTVAGYIDILESERVLMSAGQGKISKLVKAGLITQATILPTDVTTPVLTSATLGSPSSGDVTFVGTGLTSTAPEVSTVRFRGAGVGSVTLTKTQITGVGGGVYTDTSIVVKASLIAGLTTGDTVTVRADALVSNTKTF